MHMVPYHIFPLSNISWKNFYMSIEIFICFGITTKYSNKWNILCYSIEYLKRSLKISILIFSFLSAKNVAINNDVQTILSVYGYNHRIIFRRKTVEWKGNFNYNRSQILLITVYIILHSQKLYLRVPVFPQLYKQYAVNFWISANRLRNFSL